MSKVYINSVASISAQRTFDNSEFLEAFIDHDDTVMSVIDPNYKEYIPPAAARRMAKGIKMGVVASKIALQEAKLENVDAIITGTGFGCTVDSEKFVSALIDNDEQYLTPTSFIQSTHNTVGGQIALGLGCKGYNFTYVHASISFESALLDAQLQLENDEASSILVGGVDESGDHTVKIHRLINHIKKEKIKSSELLKSKTEGAIFSEGANFFVLSNSKQNDTYATLGAIVTYNTLAKENLNQVLEDFLKENNLDVGNIDVVVMGNNGDVTFDSWYHELSKGLFKNTAQVAFKHLCGEFYTASGFGTWLAAKMIKTQKIPEIVKLNKETTTQINTVLLYNQYRGENHSFTLLYRC
ncbi:beta-ketoacyl synthase N-terminal-like domain-containing protein [uncultured Kriegella sp.]|uniref:beta-ketoacyl synthase N-terminal-like domain-containing protein n=1 Tax=uncultured Kriegella sp. TaxID=1798910 RepID=UPI0030DD142A|tara:strand:+ start:84773 stop:85837 length:1065 start_codon:yes stop_codon:yes gene_type:complete